ncbi:hypothetical protein AB0J80_10355 [Actinoplanes sp. NPDC049548]|uniref:hypothetical protein n=1 Tax=Actinoplanes sp. NPDC049548 TaxID=3155152 RepID=UPI00342F1A68
MPPGPRTPDESWTRYATADLDRLRRPGPDRPGSIRTAQAERYVAGLAAPGDAPGPKWRDYLRRFVEIVNLARGRVAPVAAQPASDAPAEPSWADRAKEFAPHLLPLARQLDELNAALTPNRGNDSFRRLFSNGKLELTKLFHEEATRALQKAVDRGEQQIAQQAFDRRVQAGPAPQPQPPSPTLPSLIAQAAHGNVEQQRAVPRTAAPSARPALQRSTSAPASARRARK